MGFNEEAIETFKEWLTDDLESAKEDDPDVGLFRNDYLVDLIQHVQINLKEMLEAEEKLNFIVSGIRQICSQEGCDGVPYDDFMALTEGRNPLSVKHDPPIIGEGDGGQDYIDHLLPRCTKEYRSNELAERIPCVLESAHQGNCADAHGYWPEQD